MPSYTSSLKSLLATKDDISSQVPADVDTDPQVQPWNKSREAYLKWMKQTAIERNSSTQGASGKDAQIRNTVKEMNEQGTAKQASVSTVYARVRRSLTESKALLELMQT